MTILEMTMEWHWKEQTFGDLTLESRSQIHSKPAASRECFGT